MLLAINVSEAVFIAPTERNLSVASGKLSMPGSHMQ
jgi:hypothetical protein